MGVIDTKAEMDIARIAKNRSIFLLVAYFREHDIHFSEVRKYTETLDRNAQELASMLEFAAKELELKSAV